MLLSILQLGLAGLVHWMWFRLWPPARRQARQEREREQQREATRSEFKRERFFWPHWHSLDGQSVLRMIVSGWDNWKHPDGNADGERWSGEARFEPDGPDYDFWVWMIHVKKIARIVGESDLPAYRAEFEAVGTPAPPPARLP